jgi:hypothetical protein
MGPNIFAWMGEVGVVISKNSEGMKQAQCEDIGRGVGAA